MPTNILIGLWIATVAQTVFVVVYGLRTPWRSGFVGRALFLKSAVVWLLFASSLFRYYQPALLDPFWTGVVLTWLLAFAVVFQCAALLERMFFDRRPVHDRRR